MSPDLQTRLSEIAADLERGQAEQPLADFIAGLAADFRGAHRAVLVAIGIDLPGVEATRSIARLNVAGGRWDWLVVQDASAALKDIATWNELVGFSPLVVVVTAVGATVPAPMAALLAALASARKRGACLVVSPTPAPAPTGVPAAFLPAVKIASFDPATDWTAGLRQAPAETSEQVRQWLEGFATDRAVLPLAARIEAQRQRANAQRAVLDQRQTLLMSQRDMTGGRVKLDQARDACLQVLEAQEKEVVEDSRVFLAAKGEGTTRLKAIIEQLGDSLVHEELRPKVCILTVDEDEVRRLLQQVQALFWKHAKRSLEQADRAVTAALGDFGAQLRAAFSEATPPAATPLDQERIAKAIEPMLHANVSYRGELPVKGFFERVQASRQVVFLVVGLLSLAGASAFARNPVVILITLALFSIMLFKTARDFREETVEAKDRELQRLLELLRTNLRQLLQELEAVRLNVWRDHLQNQRRAVAAALEQAARAGLARQAREVEDERQKIQLKLRATDKLLRDLSSLEQRIQSLVLPVRQSRSKAELAFGQALRAP